MSEPQEWTPERVMSYIRTRMERKDWAVDLARDINAALNAERKKVREQLRIIVCEWPPESVGSLVGETFNGAWKIAEAHNTALADERERYKMALSDSQRRGKKLDKLTQELAEWKRLTQEVRQQREWLIKECKRIGVTVHVRIGAPITEAYLLTRSPEQPPWDGKPHDHICAICGIKRMVKVT